MELKTFAQKPSPDCSYRCDQGAIMRSSPRARAACRHKCSALTSRCTDEPNSHLPRILLIPFFCLCSRRMARGAWIVAVGGPACPAPSPASPAFYPLADNLQLELAEHAEHRDMALPEDVLVSRAR